MEQINEELLSVWLTMSSSIRNDRVVSSMSFNEIRVLHLLYQTKKKGGEPLTATDLCRGSGLLKSQMNKVLSNLERQNMIRKERSREDKRRIYIYINEDHIQVYEKEHRRILGMIDMLIGQMGEEKAKEAVILLKDMTKKMSRILNNA